MKQKSNKIPAAKPAAGKKKSTVSKPKCKNVSQKVPNGRTLQTRDEYFYGDSKYRKPGYRDKGMYRKVVVLDSNRNDELVVIKLTTSKKGTRLPDYQKGKSRYRPFVRTKDDAGKAIKIGKRFKENPSRADVSKKDVAKIKKDVFKDCKNAKRNRKAAQEVKGRKKSKK